MDLTVSGNFPMEVRSLPANAGMGSQPLARSTVSSITPVNQHHTFKPPQRAGILKLEGSDNAEKNWSWCSSTSSTLIQPNRGYPPLVPLARCCSRTNRILS
jgi:hypothetical protein